MMCRSLFFLRPTPALIAADKPNVLFIMALDLRPELASYVPPALTPNLQRLAKRGGQFTFAYLARPATIPRARMAETERTANSLFRF
jgi:arylsulfatase A-like enzyme